MGIWKRWAGKGGGADRVRLCVWVISGDDEEDVSCVEIEGIGAEVVVAVCAVRERGAKRLRYGVKFSGCWRANGFSGGGECDGGGAGSIAGMKREEENGKRNERRVETGGRGSGGGGGGAHDGLDVVSSSL